MRAAGPCHRQRGRGGAPTTIELAPARDPGGRPEQRRRPRVGCAPPLRPHAGLAWSIAPGAAAAALVCCTSPAGAALLQRRDHAGLHPGELFRPHGRPLRPVLPQQPDHRRPSGSVVLALPFAATTGYSSSCALPHRRALGPLPAVLGHADAAAGSALVLPVAQPVRALRALQHGRHRPASDRLHHVSTLPFLTLDPDGLLRRHPGGSRMGGDDRRRHRPGAPSGASSSPVSLPGIAAAGRARLHPGLERVPVSALRRTGDRDDPGRARGAARPRTASPSPQVSAGGDAGGVLPLAIASRFIQRFLVQGLTFGSV